MTQDLQTRRSAADSLPAPIKRISYEEFLRSSEYEWAEWVDGEVIQLSPASRGHQLLVDFLTSLLRIFIETKQSGVVLSAPFQMKTGEGLPGREPDILYVSNESGAKLKETYLDGPADVAVEVISPESLVRDRGAKFSEYEKGGVKEYWLIDPKRRLAEFYRLEEGVYHQVAIDEGIYRSEVIDGFWLKVDWMWQEPLPLLMGVLKDLGLVLG